MIDDEKYLKPEGVLVPIVKEQPKHLETATTLAAQGFWLGIYLTENFRQTVWKSNNKLTNLQEGMIDSIIKASVRYYELPRLYSVVPLEQLLEEIKTQTLELAQGVKEEAQEGLTLYSQLEDIGQRVMSGKVNEEDLEDTLQLTQAAEYSFAVLDIYRKK